MKGTLSYDTLDGLEGKNVCSVDGEKIGTVKEIFCDDTTRTPEWLGIGTGLLGTGEKVIPLEGASITGDTVIVNFDKETVKKEPKFDEQNGILTPESEKMLSSYFGLTGRETSTGTHRLSRYNFTV
jgi:sporulation protein YlmC with PRC-barrel domain